MLFSVRELLSTTALALFVLAPVPLRAQQTEPALEVYALLGGYASPRELSGHYGGGLLAPLGRNWAGIADVTTIVIKVARAQSSVPSDFIHERQFVFTPSLVRMWRQENFSFYVGGGLGVASIRQNIQTRRVVGEDEDGQPLYGEDYDRVKVSDTDAGVVVRGGMIADLTERLVFRADVFVLPRNFEERVDKSFTFGIGYRF